MEKTRYELIAGKNPSFNPEQRQVLPKPEEFKAYEEHAEFYLMLEELNAMVNQARK